MLLSIVWYMLWGVAIAGIFFEFQYFSRRLERVLEEVRRLHEAMHVLRKDIERLRVELESPTSATLGAWDRVK